MERSASDGRRNVMQCRITLGVIGALFFVPPQQMVPVLTALALLAGAVLAALLAIHFGFDAVILLAVLIYAVACVALRAFAR